MASHGVRVTGIPRHEGDNVERMKDQITIYFQKKSNGGGDVDLVLFPLSSKRQDVAMVFFNDKAVIDTVMKRNHRLFESEVKVQPKPPQPFSSVRAVISAEMLDLIGEREEFFENLSVKTGVTKCLEIKKEGKVFTIEGGYYQFQNVQRFLEKYIDEKVEDEFKQSRRSAAQSEDNVEHTEKDQKNPHQPTSVEVKYPPNDGYTPDYQNVGGTMTTQTSNRSRLTLQVKTVETSASSKTENQRHVTEETSHKGQRSPTITERVGQELKPDERKFTVPETVKIGVKTHCVGDQTYGSTLPNSEMIDNTDKILGEKSHRKQTEEARDRNSKLDGSTEKNPEKSGSQISSGIKGQKQDTSETRSGSVGSDAYDNENISDISECSCELRVDSDIFAFVKHVHSKELSDIKSRYQVEVSQKMQDDISVVKIFIKHPTAQSKECLEKASLEMGKLYQDTFFGIRHQSLDLDVSKSDMTMAGGEVQMKHPKVYVKMQESKMVFYGKERDVENAKSTLRRFLGLPDPSDNSKTDKMVYEFDDRSSVEIPSSAQQARKGRRHGKPEPSSPRPDPSADRYPGSVGGYPDRCQVNMNGISILVYRGDITHENTDVIVNAANEDLDHIGGLAAAISDAAGYQLQNECRDILRRRNYQPLASSEIVPSRAYALKCKRVIHAVGPRWYHFTDKNLCISLLKETFQNCLICADRELKVRSIAIPAVSSGIFGVPKPVCAQTLFDAVTEFCSSQTSDGILKEIRLVNIDHESTEEILKIFKGQRLPTARHQDETRMSAGLRDADFRAPRGKWEYLDRGKEGTYGEYMTDDDSDSSL